MHSEVLLIFLFGVCALAISAGLLMVGGLIGPKRNSSVKQMPYESGMDPLHDTRRRFDVRFHLVAVAFLIFDVELLFLYPWAVASNSQRHPTEGMPAIESFSNHLVFGEVMVFVVLLAAGLAYAWRKGVFRWR